MSDPQIVYVVDENVQLSQDVADVLRRGGLRPQVCTSVDALRGALPPVPRGVVISELRLAGTDGLALLRQHTPDPVSLPVIILTAHADVPTTVQLMRAGALDVLEKPCEPDSLLRVVQAALAQEAEAWARGSSTADLRRRIDSLTPREREVLEQLALGKSNRDTGEALGISPRTVEVHRGRIMNKMRADSMTGLVRELVAHGLHHELARWSSR